MIRTDIVERSIQSSLSNRLLSLAAAKALSPSRKNSMVILSVLGQLYAAPTSTPREIGQST